MQRKDFWDETIEKTYQRFAGSGNSFRADAPVCIAAEPENTAEKTFPVTVSVTGGENTYNYTLLNDGTYNYTLLNDGTAELTGFLPGVSVADAVIPSAVKGHPVTSIGESAFVNCTALQSVRFEAPIKSIGTIAFGFCTGLTSIALPEGLETIGQSAFAYCTSLASVTIPQSIQVIKFGAFNYGPGTDKKLQELYYTGTETQWDELMKKKSRIGRRDMITRKRLER